MTLLECREKLGWTAKRAYTFLGLSPQTYRKYEEADEELMQSARYQEYQSKLSSELTKNYIIDSTTDDFAFLRERHAYFIDKSLLIKEIIETGQTSILLARPRRFGKSLNLSMIAHFFDQSSNPRLFDGLAICQEESIVQQYQNQFPVIFLTLKDVEGASFDLFQEQLADAISFAIAKFPEVLSSDKVEEVRRLTLKRCLDKKGSIGDLKTSLLTLCASLQAHYGKRAVLLVDEYDAPLQKASEQDYYDEALDLISGLLSAAMKSNPSLERGILTGCLRISKESVFTGLNNVSVYTLYDARFQSFFGFTEGEVKRLLLDYHLSEKAEEVRRYYDGYPALQGNLYCPFDLMHYVSDHIADKNAKPGYYWMNTSENEIIHALLRLAQNNTRDELDRLILGEPVKKSVNFRMTYRDLYADPDNVYSVLVASGYLVPKKQEEDFMHLVIPNEEVRYIFKTQFQKWIEERAGEEGKEGTLLRLLLQGQLKEATKNFSSFLWDTIGIHDYSRPEAQREAFYHGLLLGVLGANRDKRYKVYSNREGGNGFLDIALLDVEANKGAIIECKYAGDGDFDSSAKKAQGQIRANRYDEFFYGYPSVAHIGASFYRKACLFIEEN